MIDRLAFFAGGFLFRTERKTAITITALDEILFAHFQIDFGMAQRAPSAVATLPAMTWV